MAQLFKTRPFQHQLDEYLRSSSARTRALFWEMGCGKTKPTIDTVCRLSCEREVTGLLVLAPRGVERAWLEDELPTHMWDDVASQCRTFLWRTSKAGQVGYRLEWEKFLEDKSPLKVLSMNFDAMRTDLGARAAKTFLEQRRCLYVVDESQFIKSPTSIITNRVLASASWAPYRRILTGTPVDDSPFDVYSQVRFLDEGIWHGMGIRSHPHFNATFGEFTQVQFNEPKTSKKGRKIRGFKKLVRYRNLEVLHRVLDSVGSRLQKSEVLDLPPKLYRKVYFELSPEQQTAYDSMRRQFFVQFRDGSLATAELAITRSMRLQQITSGYLPADTEDELRPLGRTNARIELLREVVSEVPGKMIIWGKFDVDIDALWEALSPDHECVRYDGRTSEEDRALAKERFQKGSARIFLGKESCAGTGLTLHAATTVIYYNTTWRLGKRLQSEDRAHRIGQEHPVQYIDLCAAGTIDELIIHALREKRDIASFIMGDEVEEWI